MNLEGTGIVVTGASRGLGKELSREFAKRGARVVMVARGEAALNRAVAEIRAEGGDAHAAPFDVADKDDTYRISGVAAALAGAVDVVVHNASTLGPVPLRPLLETECEDFEEVLATNVLGPFRLTKALAGAMALRRRGLVVFVSSDAATNAYPTWGAYGVSKAAADHLARSFAAEVPDVAFLSVDPGEMDTEMHAAAVPDADRTTLARPADVAARIVELVIRSHEVERGARVDVSAPHDAAAVRAGEVQR